MFLFALVSFLFHTSYASFVSCGTKNTLFNVESLSVTPDPPIPGKEYIMSIYFTVPNMSLDNGTSYRYCMVEDLGFNSVTQDLCFLLGNCPIHVGLNEFSRIGVWPETLYGTFLEVMAWVTPEEKEILCVQFDTVIYAKDIYKYPALRGSYAKLAAHVDEYLNNKMQPICVTRKEDRSFLYEKNNNYSNSLTLYTRLSDFLVDDTIYFEDA